MTVLVRAETAGGGCALPVDRTRGVLPLGDVQPLPSAAPGVVGLVRHRGEALPLLAPFGTDGAHVLVVEDGGERFGLLVRRVTGIVRLAPGELDPAPAGQGEPLVTGIVRRAGAEALVLDPAALRRRLRP